MSPPPEKCVPSLPPRTGSALDDAQRHQAGDQPGEPAPSVTAATASTSLYASGASSARPRHEEGRTAMPRASSSPRSCPRGPCAARGGGSRPGRRRGRRSGRPRCRAGRPSRTRRCPSCRGPVPAGPPRRGRRAGPGGRAAAPAWRPCGGRTAGVPHRPPRGFEFGQVVRDVVDQVQTAPGGRREGAAGGFGEQLAVGAAEVGGCRHRPQVGAALAASRPVCRPAAGPEPGCRAGAYLVHHPDVVGAHLVPQAARAAVDHDAHLAHPQPERPPQVAAS